MCLQKNINSTKNKLNRKRFPKLWMNHCNLSTWENIMFVIPIFSRSFEKDYFCSEGLLFVNFRHRFSELKKMAMKVRILSMLLTIHSLGLLFASLFTYRWYVDDQKEVGVFGMCEVANKTSVNRMILVANRTNARSASHLPFQVDSLFATSFRSFSLLSSSGGENKSMTCYKLLWPTSDEAFAYLASWLILIEPF